MSEKQDEHSAATHCYAVLLYCAVQCSDGTLHVEKQVAMPFVPWARLVIEDLDATEYEIFVQSVYWNFKNGLFMCRCDALDGYAGNINDVRQAFVACGWIESA